MDAVYDAVVGSTTIRQITNTRFSSGLEQSIGRYSGGLDPQAIYVMKSEPTVSFETEDLATALAIGTDTFSSVGSHISSGTITIPFQRRSLGGTFAGAGANMRLNATHALFVPTSISGNQGDDAKLSIEGHFYNTTGLTTPVTASVNQNLASQAYVAKYAMGTAFITPSGGASTQLVEVVGITVNPGITVMTEYYNGGVYPQKVFITRREPVIEITVKSFDDLYTYGPIGAVVDGCVVYFRKRADGGTFASDASSVHISFSFGAGLAVIQDISASANDNGTGTIRITGKALTCDTTAALA